MSDTEVARFLRNFITKPLGKLLPDRGQRHLVNRADADETPAMRCQVLDAQNALLRIERSRLAQPGKHALEVGALLRVLPGRRTRKLSACVVEREVVHDQRVPIETQLVEVDSDRGILRLLAVVVEYAHQDPACSFIRNSPDGDKHVLVTAVGVGLAPVGLIGDRLAVHAPVEHGLRHLSDVLGRRDVRVDPGVVHPDVFRLPRLLLVEFGLVGGGEVAHPADTDAPVVSNRQAAHALFRIVVDPVPIGGVQIPVPLAVEHGINPWQGREDVGVGGMVADGAGVEVVHVLNGPESTIEFAKIQRVVTGLPASVRQLIGQAGERIVVENREGQVPVGVDHTALDERAVHQPHAIVDVAPVPGVFAIGVPLITEIRKEFLVLRLPAPADDLVGLVVQRYTIACPMQVVG